MKSNIIKKSIFLYSVEYVYSHCSDNYLIALRDALNIVIRQRKVGGCKPYEDYYKGVVRL